METMGTSLDTVITVMHTIFGVNTIHRLEPVLRQVSREGDTVLTYQNSVQMANYMKSQCRDPLVVDYSLKNYIGYYAVGERFRNNEYLSVLTLHKYDSGTYSEERIMFVFGPDKRLGD